MYDIITCSCSFGIIGRGVKTPFGGSKSGFKKKIKQSLDGRCSGSHPVADNFLSASEKN
jgi:hypothetical protein